MAGKTNATPPLTQYGYKYEQQCKICTAIDTITGQSLRPEIDRMYTEKHDRSEIEDFLKEKAGISISRVSITNHFKKHAPYVEMARKNIPPPLAPIAMGTGMPVAQVEVENVLYYILDKGFEKLKSGEIVVTEKLLTNTMKMLVDLKDADKVKDLGNAIREAWLKKASEARLNSSQDAVDGVVEVERVPELEGETNGDTTGNN